MAKKIAAVVVGLAALAALVALYRALPGGAGDVFTALFQT